MTNPIPSAIDLARAASLEALGREDPLFMLRWLTARYLNCVGVSAGYLRLPPVHPYRQTRQKMRKGGL